MLTSPDPLFVYSNALDASPYLARGRVKTTIRLRRSRIGRMKMLPSGPVLPPLRIGLPAGCVASR